MNTPDPQEEKPCWIRTAGIQEEDFVNYKLPSMFIATCFCTWKCPLEQGLDISICQNSELAHAETKKVPYSVIYNHFISNPITEAIVIGGLEPFLQSEEMLGLVKYFRENGCDAPFVIYTGYYPNEVKTDLMALSTFKNIIVKFGRYRPNEKAHYDELLGVNLASGNQYAKRIS